MRGPAPRAYEGLQLYRYGVLFPLDVLRLAPYAAVRSLVRLAARGRLAPALDARLLYRLFFRRRPDAGFARVVDWIGRPGVGGLRFALGCFMWPASLERRVLGIDSVAAHHAARLALVREKSPPAREILDLGGSAAGIPEGGLLHMGYPHAPARVTIVDLPPEGQFWKHARPEAAEARFGDTVLRYHYSGMDDLSAIASGTVDGVWSGQSIEHVTTEAADRAFREVLRVLRPGGWFCLDTPNRLLTKSLCRVGWIHPEHRHEYAPRELCDRLAARGFEVEETCAVSAMPVSRRLGRFCKHEVAFGAPLGDDPEDGYSFFVRARKPALAHASQRASLGACERGRDGARDWTRTST